VRATSLLPFDALETCFRLLTDGPAPLALDGRHVGHGLPARQVPLGELRSLLQHPAATSDLHWAVLQELVHLASHDRDKWTLGLAGVLLPGFRRIAASVASVDRRAAADVQADMLERFRNAVRQPEPGVVEFGVAVLRSACAEQLPAPRPVRCGCPLGS
jgi:hypothetical protein